VSAPSRQEVGAAIDVLRVLAEAIRAAGEIPSGHLYAHVMGQLSLESYGSALGVLKRAGLVEERNNLLRWVGPALEGAPR
jgi:hypothetical protein